MGEVCAQELRPEEGTGSPELGLQVVASFPDVDADN